MLTSNSNSVDRFLRPGPTIGRIPSKQTRRKTQVVWNAWSLSNHGELLVNINQSAIIHNEKKKSKGISQKKLCQRP